jgi:predicted DsbA family dithiol-disulfide isomerase
MTTIEVFADVACPFTHVGLRRLVAARAAAGRDDVVLLVRAWPLEIVNGHPLDPGFIDEEVVDIRAQVAPDLFTGFRPDAFPASSLPALALTDAAYRVGPTTGEHVALRLRDLLFEEGVDIADPSVLAGVATEAGVSPPFDDHAAVLADHAEGVSRGVIGSPHFFLPDGDGVFCPSLDVSRADDGHLHVAVDTDALDHFLARCFP